MKNDVTTRLDRAACQFELAATILQRLSRDLHVVLGDQPVIRQMEGTARYARAAANATDALKASFQQDPSP